MTTFGRKDYAHRLILQAFYKSVNRFFRWLYPRCSPLPIPNREVKPARADGTALRCGRVGRCRTISKASGKTQRLFYFPKLFRSCYQTNARVFAMLLRTCLPHPIPLLQGKGIYFFIFSLLQGRGIYCFSLSYLYERDVCSRRQGEVMLSFRTQ